MLYLNNTLLTADGIIVELKKINAEQTDHLKSFKKKLASIYFPKMNIEQIKTVIESERFAEFPQLKFVLREIFFKEQHPGDINIAALEDWTPPATYTHKKFQELNAEYGYFQEQGEPIFNTLKPLCRKMTQLVERQADDNEMAYKLMALFCAPQDLLNPDKCLEKISKSFIKISQQVKYGTPYHNAFVTELNHFPTVADAKNIQEWRQFILKFGFPALPLFADCASFESVPKTLKEAQAAQLTKIYPRAQENPNFAAFCKSLLIKNDGFEAGLNFIKTGWPKKQSDNLPLVDIKVSDETYEYRWVKLPPDDKRALYLGNMIPGCCQFINGDSRQCVIDGISLSDNGFYVLLKRKTPTQEVKEESKKVQADDLPDGDIVAQSYAWMSTNGNFCLDSIEWDRRRVTSAILKTLMDKFASEILARNPQIKFVNVGKGGQTPRNFCGDAFVSETQRQGTAYGDSASQYCIQSKLTPKATQLLGEMTDFKTLHGDLQKKIRYLSAYLEPKDVSLETIQNTSSLLRSSLIYPFPPITQQLTASDFQRLTFGDYQQLPTNEQEKISTFRKLLNCESIDGFMQWLRTIPDQELSNIIKMRTQDGAMLFHLAALMPDDLEYILSRLPEQACLDLNRTKDKDRNTLLHLAASNPKSLQTILSHLPVEAHLDNVKTTNQDGNTVLHLAANSPESLQTILSHLPAPACLDAIKKMDRNDYTVLHLAARNPDSLKIILEIIPKGLPITEVQKEGVLRSAAVNPESLQMILDIIPGVNRLDAVLKSRALRHAADNPKSLGMILDIIPKDQQLAAVQETTVLHNAAGNPESLKMILAIIPPVNRLAAVQKRTPYGTVLHLAAGNPESLKMILAIIPPVNRLAAVQEKDPQNYRTVLHNAAGNPESLKMILDIIPEVNRPAAVQEKDYGLDSVLHLAANNLESLKIILAIIPPENLLKEVTAKNLGDHSVLVLAAYSPECCKTIMECLPKANRLDAVKMEVGEYPTLLHLALLDPKVSWPDTLIAILEPLTVEERLNAVYQIRIGNMNVLEFCTQERPELVDALGQLLKNPNSSSVSSASMFQTDCSPTADSKQDLDKIKKP